MEDQNNENINENQEEIPETPHEKTEAEIASEFPGFSEYEERNHCCCKMTYYPSIRTYFWGEWEFQPFMPCFVIFLIVSSYLVGMIFCFPLFGYENLFLIPLITFLFAMFLFSYIQIIRIGPGYFPFYWGAKSYLQSKNPIDETNPINNGNSDDYLLGNDEIICPKNGILTTMEQYEWSHQLKRPERCILARSARRIVLRPDHLCDWTTVWIGKRNHKLFMLFNAYGCIYLAVYSFYMARAVIEIFSNPKSLSVFLILSIYGILAATFSILTMTFVISSLWDLRHNQTSWESWNNKEFIYDR